MKREVFKALRAMLFCLIPIALTLAFIGLLNIVIARGHRVHGRASNGLNETSPSPSTPDSYATTSLPRSTPDTSTPPESADQGRQTYQIGEYFRLYGERQRSLLASDSTNLNLEAVRHAGDWKRAGDWDQGFLQMQETLKASVDPAPAVPAFQIPPLQVPAVQLSAVPTCCVAH